MIGGILIIFICTIILFPGNKGEKDEHYSNQSAITPNHPIESTDIGYNGETNSIGIGEIEAILERRYPYYTWLQPELREKFENSIKSESIK